MLVRPFSDIHVEYSPDNYLPNLLVMVVSLLVTDRVTVAVIAGDLDRPEAWLTVLRILARQFMS
jgi:hypothetical protein